MTPHQGADRPEASWNTSTTMLYTLRSGLRAQGWATGTTAELPVSDASATPLPRRPLDLGVGWWR